MQVAWELNYDRRVSADFLRRFKAGPPRLLADIARSAPYPVDLQFRRDPKTGHEHASLYVGLTDVLKVDAKPKTDRLRLGAHPTWSDTDAKPKAEQFGFKREWSDYGIADGDWADIEDYLERVLPAATKTHASAEGSVQAAVSTFKHSDLIVLDREATLSFRDTATKDELLRQAREPVVHALQGVTGVKGKAKTTYGGECDLLAINNEGQLLAIEIKPRNVGGIRWAAAQATVYSRLFELWLSPDPTRPDALDVLRGQWDQRAELRLARKRRDTELRARPVVVPVVVIQRRTRPDLIAEFRRVHHQLLSAGVGSQNLKLYESGLTGRLVPIAI